jgi:predicted ATPase/DNA-binding winged helix-turn-helix (wHTH) protein
MDQAARPATPPAAQRAPLQGTLSFGRFAVLPSRREVRVDGALVDLGARAFDILLALIEARGAVVAKDELIERVWPGRVVEENNLQVQIATVRRILGSDRDLIRTVAGRGYQFAGEVRVERPEAPGIAPARAVLTNLPEAVSPLIGRDTELHEILTLAADRRLVTLTGPGGIGKTRLGLEVARELLGAFRDGVWLVELGGLNDPGQVPYAVAAALGLTFATGALPPERVATALGSRHMLVVLDNCEHVIDAAAAMTEAVLRASPVACVLVTSREPLRAEGESVYRVPSLEVPDETMLDRTRLLRTGAVRLFIARTRAAEPQFSPDIRIAAIAAICRRLDGIPLAIELAAARAAALGIEGLAARLDDRFRLLTGGHRTALPRHQTLRATLDWSYELLPTTERVVLRRLGVFAGTFTLESAAAVVATEDIAATDVIDYLANLVAKSLVTVEVGSAVAQYRLLDTMRAYALEKLKEASELDTFARRHAEHHRDLFDRTSEDWVRLTTAEWLTTYGRQIDNLRVALDWAFSANGDTDTGVALTAAAAPFWMRLSLMEECRARVERALTSLGPEASRNTPHGMQLHTALGLALMYTHATVEASHAELRDALEIAQRLGDADFQLRSLWGLCVNRLNSGLFREALTLANEFCAVAAAVPGQPDLRIGDRMLAMALHYMGDQAAARVHFERVLDRYTGPAYRAHTIRFLLDQRVSARAVLAEVLWLQGFPDQAMRAVEHNIVEAFEADHALTLCNALAKACPVALFVGDLEAAERYVTMLQDHAARNALASWQAEARCFRSVLTIRRGDAPPDANALGSALDELREIRFALRYIELLGELAELLGRAGEAVQGLAAIDEAIGRTEANGERWCLAELLRIRGELVLLQHDIAAREQAEDHFLRSLECAREQRVLAWELRASTSLARLWANEQRTVEAREQLAQVFARYTEGHGSADLRAAAELLEALR